MKLITAFMFSIYIIGVLIVAQAAWAVSHNLPEALVVGLLWPIVSAVSAAEVILTTGR